MDREQRRGMSTPSETAYSLGFAGCPRCKSTAVKLQLVHLSREARPGPEINHLEVYCTMCQTFITHFDVKPRNP